MIKCLMHEPFYTDGTYFNEDLGLWSGWVVTKDLSPIAFLSGTKRKTSAFSFRAKISPTRLTSMRLKCVDTNLAQMTQVISSILYEEMGSAFLEKLNGWFSGVLVDLREQKFVLFNDRYGVNRIYYHEDARGLYFSSEAKALLKVLPSTRQLDLRSLGEVLSCEAVLENRSLFSGISLLPPGSSWVFSRGEPVKKKTYFKQEAWENQPELSESEFYEKLKETWARVLPRYFLGKQSIGLVSNWRGRQPDDPGLGASSPRAHFHAIPGAAHTAIARTSRSRGGPLNFVTSLTTRFSWAPSSCRSFTTLPRKPFISATAPWT